MRISSRVAIILVVFSGQAWAKGKKAPPAAPKPSSGMMDSNDPAEKETSDGGPFAPKRSDEESKEKSAAEGAEEPVIRRRPRDKVAVFGNVVIGFGKPAEPDPNADANPTNKGTGVTFMVGGRYDVSPDFSVGLRLPWTTASLRQTDGSTASSQALGNPELTGEYRVALSSHSILPVDFGIGVPVAQGNYDRTGTYRQAIVNDFADAASGFRDGELFGPKHLPLIVGVGIDYERKALNLHAATKVVAGVKVGGTVDFAPDPAGSFELKSVTFRSVTSAGIGYQFWDKPKLFGAVDSWLAYNAVNTLEFNSSEGVTPPTRFQVVFEPRLGARFDKISPSLGYIFPIGGRLADNHTSGLELHCDVAF